jgi:uncharacterized membrane protein YkoI
MNINIIATVATVIFCCFCSTTCFSQKSAPTAVREAFSQKFPGVSDVDWDKENANEWEAEFEQNGKDISVNFRADGSWLETETEIQMADLPAPVQAALQGKKVREVARIERADGTTVFEAEIGKKDWLFDSAGKRLN